MEGPVMHDGPAPRWTAGVGVLLGAGATLLLLSAVDLVATGYRVDEQGTSPTTFEQASQWGGLLVGVLVLSVAAVLVLRRPPPDAHP
jgi:hypothetical protein